MAERDRANAVAAYEKDFYKKENIIGYTGDLNNNPSVYFKNGNKFGRITQVHDDATNIGRNEVREAADYTIANRRVNGRQCAVETYTYNGRQGHHCSRGQFIAVAQNDADTLNILARALILKPEAKVRVLMQEGAFVESN
jgi:hypothetical protein